MGSLPTKYDTLYIPERKRILIYSSCFCPPNKSHAHLIKTQLANFDQVHIFIDGEKERKHKIRTTSILTIWNTIIAKYPLDAQKKFEFHVAESDNVQFAIRWAIANVPKESDVTHIVGASLKLSQKENLSKSYFQQQAQSRPDIKYSFVQLENRSTSTKQFIQCLTAAYNNCISYMPDDFDEETKKKYQEMLRSDLRS